MSDGVVTPRPVLLLVCAAVLGDVTALAAHRTIADPWVDSRSSTPRFGYTPFHNLHADSLKLPNRNLKMSRGYPARVGTGCAGPHPVRASFESTQVRLAMDSVRPAHRIREKLHFHLLVIRVCRRCPPLSIDST
jgi:hypothetical protein